MGSQGIREKGAFEESRLRSTEAVPFLHEKSSPHSRRSKCKGPKEGDCLEYSRNSERPLWLEQSE